MNGRPREIAWRWIPIVLLLSALTADAGEETPSGTPRAVKIEETLPFGQQPIDYAGEQTEDAVRKLAKELESGNRKLDWKPTHGYLPALLSALDVSVNSQLLAFSKTALNPNLVSPKNPRAIYFNDEVSVGWVPGAESIEITAIDPVKGAMFYILEQSEERPAKIQRQDRCLACHVGTTTYQTPGWIVRSFVTDGLGRPTSGYSRVTHETPFANRFGGWYVTGRHGEQPHSGNIFGDDVDDRLKEQPLAGGNRTEIGRPFAVEKYLSGQSDLVAHLVLQHQAHGQNVIARVSLEARLNRRSDAEERLARYLLFADEPPLLSPVSGTTRFADQFERGQHEKPDPGSLRQFNLKTRLMEHRLSYLIDSRAYRAIPDEARNRVEAAIEAALSSDSESDLSAHLARAERETLLPLLKARRLR